MVDADMAAEQALVRSGWELVDLLGKIGTGPSQRMLSGRWEAERARAAALVKLKTGSKVPSGMLALYEGPSNWTRFRRTLDYVRPADRLFEIGIGRGYLAGMFLRDGEIDAYRGIDLLDLNVESTKQTLELNGLAGRAEVAQGNLYDLTREDVERFGGTLVVCCEVIEHVPDPELAVRTLADALPPGCDLLISVPVLGRLEGVWGHLALFDARRIRRMVADAGLVVHAVDVVDNTWVFVLANRDERPSARATAAVGALSDGLAETEVDPEIPRAMRGIDLAAPEIGPSRWNRRLSHARVEHQADGLLCELKGTAESEADGVQYGGVRIPVRSPRGIRLELGLDDIDSVETFYVDAYAGEERVARWKWEPGKRRPKRNPATFVLRPGVTGANFRPVRIDDLVSADAFDVFAKLRPGGSTRFRITRASLVVGDDG